MNCTNTVVNIESATLGVDCLTINYSINYFEETTLKAKASCCDTILERDIVGWDKSHILFEVLSWFQNYDRVVYTEAFTISLEKYLYYRNIEL